MGNVICKLFGHKWGKWHWELAPTHRICMRCWHREPANQNRDRPWYP